MGDQPGHWGAFQTKLTKHHHSLNCTSPGREVEYHIGTSNEG